MRSDFFSLVEKTPPVNCGIKRKSSRLVVELI